jgi:hypothetical protein
MYSNERSVVNLGSQEVINKLSRMFFFSKGFVSMLADLRHISDHFIQ